MIPAGICKRICDPGMDVPLDNDDSKVKHTQKRSTAIPRHLEYPEDVSVALADEELIYDSFGVKKSELNYKSTCQKQISLAVKGKKGREALVKKLKYAAPLQETQYGLESKRSEVNLARRNRFEEQKSPFALETKRSDVNLGRKKYAGQRSPYGLESKRPDVNLARRNRYAGQVSYYQSGSVRM
ncbi:hypothetical protein ANCCAN_25540 [Ancylostoma caninum]|uniref:Uncharacterized protein n=1 Tax=Ancylostoma caninum TaxID=29170 RepID=A0A368F9C6_ANCCA|nr:hypothetical protein ANCCAN_25540 [Ancylostoma caninum]